MKNSPCVHCSRVSSQNSMTSYLTLKIGLIFVLFSLSCGGQVAGLGGCSSGEFWDSLLSDCRTCSSCPMNQIIRTPCHANEDTICGPFYEFQDFQHNHGLLKVDNTADDNARFQHQDVADQPGAYTNPSESADLSAGLAEQRWRALCFSLTGALAILSLLAILYIVYTQLQVRRTRHNSKAILITDPEDPTVYYKPNSLSDHLPNQQLKTTQSVMVVNKNTYQLCSMDDHDSRQKALSIKKAVEPSHCAVEGYMTVPGIRQGDRGHAGACAGAAQGRGNQVDTQPQYLLVRDNMTSKSKDSGIST